jgi:hypothetical protein
MPPVHKQAGLSQSQLCFRFNIDGSNMARKARKAEQTSQEYLEKQTGWRSEKSDRNSALLKPIIVQNSLAPSLNLFQALNGKKASKQNYICAQCNIALWSQGLTSTN